MREEVSAELVRWLGTPEAVRRAVEERLRINVPLGLLTDWRPEGAEASAVRRQKGEQP
jgi:hypothetical protein